MASSDQGFINLAKARANRLGQVIKIYCQPQDNSLHLVYGANYPPIGSYIFGTATPDGKFRIGGKIQ
jgi:hypothetical protein